MASPAPLFGALLTSVLLGVVAGPLEALFCTVLYPPPALESNNLTVSLTRLLLLRSPEAGLTGPEDGPPMGLDLLLVLTGEALNGEA